MSVLDALVSLASSFSFRWNGEVGFVLFNSRSVNSVADNTSEERILALRKRAEIDSKNLIIFVPDHEPELQQCLSRQVPLIVPLLKFLV